MHSHLVWASLVTMIAPHVTSQSGVPNLRPPQSRGSTASVAPSPPHHSTFHFTLSLVLFDLEPVPTTHTLPAARLYL